MLIACGRRCCFQFRFASQHSKICNIRAYAIFTDILQYILMSWIWGKKKWHAFIALLSPIPKFTWNPFKSNWTFVSSFSVQQNFGIFCLIMALILEDPAQFIWYNETQLQPKFATHICIIACVMDHLFRLQYSYLLMIEYDEVFKTQAHSIDIYIWSGVFNTPESHSPNCTPGSAQNWAGGVTYSVLTLRMK